MFNAILHAILQQGLTILLLAGLSFIAIGLGRFFFRKSHITFVSFGEQVFFSTGIGFAVIGYSIFLLGIFHFLHSASLYILLIILTILSIAGWLQLRTRLMTPGIPSLQPGWE